MGTAELILEILRFFFDDIRHFVGLIILVMLFGGRFAKLGNFLRRKKEEVKVRYKKKIEPGRKKEKKALPNFLRSEDATTEEYLQK